MAESSISNLFPQPQASRATEASSPAVQQPPARDGSKGPSRFESELKGDRSAKTDRPAKDAPVKAGKSAKLDRPANADAVRSDRPASQASAKTDRPASDGVAKGDMAKGDMAKGDMAKGEKAEADKSDRQALQPLRKAAAKNKQAVDSAPVVALLTGKLDRLSPAAIPELVANNEFVTSALGEVELEGFLAKPAPIRDLLENLGVPPAVMAEAEQLGLDLAAIVSPNDILRALGIDPQRVFSELKLLKDNLTLDGVQGYMRRAAAMQKGGAPEASTRPDPMQQERLTRDAEAARSTADKIPRRPAPDLTLGDSLASNQPLKGPQQPAAASAPQAAMTPAALAQLSPWQIAAGVAAPASHAPDLGTASAGQSLPSALLPRGVQTVVLAGSPSRPGALDAFAMQGLEAPAAGVLAAPSAVNMPASSGPSVSGSIAGLARAQPTSGAERVATQQPVDLSQSGPKLHQATYDAFSWMGERLRGDGTIRLEEADLAASAEMPATPPSDPVLTTPRDPGVTIERFLRDLGVSSQAVTTTQPQPGGPVANAALPQLAHMIPSQAQPAAQQPKVAASERDLELDRDAGKSVEGAWQLPAPARDTAPATPQRVSLDDLARALTFDRATIGKGDESAPGDRGSEDRSFDSQSGFDSSRIIESLGVPQHTASKGGSVSTFAAHVAAPPAALSPEDRAAIMQQVVDRATFLARDGGGTVRLDLSSADLGPVELAVSVQNDRLDLRILTASDRARDLMAGEMSQLRDALSVQSFQLGSVEVGVGRRDSGRGNEAFAAFQQNQTAQQFGGGRERRGREATWEGDVSAMASGLRGLDSARRPAALSYARMPAMPAADGRIAVRV